jgi:hypothetical protein
MDSSFLNLDRRQPAPRPSARGFLRLILAWLLVECSVNLRTREPLGRQISALLAFLLWPSGVLQDEQATCVPVSGPSPRRYNPARYGWGYFASHTIISGEGEPGF